MSLDPEYREFFLRSSKVTSGSTPDQESGYANTVKVKGVTKFNRFLKEHFPTEGVFTKLFKSLTFKLNKDDRASTTTQGLVKKSSDTDAESRTLNPAADFTLSVAPHHLPDLVLATDVDDTVIGTPAQVGGLKLSILRRAFTGGLKRKNFKLEVNLSATSSIVKQGVSEQLQLSGDAVTPGNKKHYGTNESGTKGWYDDAPWQSTKWLTVDFPSNNVVPTVISGGDVFAISIPAVGVYKFRAWLPVLLDVATGGRINLTYSAAVAITKYTVKLLDTASLLYKYLAKKTAVAGSDNFSGFTDGYIEIEGVISVSAIGLLSLEFGTKNVGAPISNVQAGAYFEVEELK